MTLVKAYLKLLNQRLRNIDKNYQKSYLRKYFGDLTIREVVSVQIYISDKVKRAGRIGQYDLMIDRCLHKFQIGEAKKKTKRENILRSLGSKAIAACKADGISEDQLVRVLSPSRLVQKRRVRELSSAARIHRHKLSEDEYRDTQASYDIDSAHLGLIRDMHGHHDNVSQAKAGQGKGISRRGKKKL